jgi:hypothetical protein
VAPRPRQTLVSENKSSLQHRHGPPLGDHSPAVFVGADTSFKGGPSYFLPPFNSGNVHRSLQWMNPRLKGVPEGRQNVAHRVSAGRVVRGSPQNPDRGDTRIFTS